MMHHMAVDFHALSGICHLFWCFVENNQALRRRQSASVSRDDSAEYIVLERQRYVSDKC